jgi:hypothetical protein
VGTGWVERPERETEALSSPHVFITCRLIN